MPSSLSGPRDVTVAAPRAAVGTASRRTVPIRPAEAQDAAQVAWLHHLGWTEGYRGLLPDDYLDSLSLPACRARWEATLSSPSVVTVLVAGAVEVLGFASYGPCCDPDAPAAGELWDLWVAGEARGRGIGKALLAAALDALAVDHHHQVAVTWVLAANSRGRAFYEREGALRDRLARTAGPVHDIRYLWDLRGRLAAEAGSE